MEPVFGQCDAVIAVGKLHHSALSPQVKRSGSQSGNQRSQIMCEKSTHNNILNMPQKTPLQHNFVFLRSVGLHFVLKHKGQIRQT
jgi:hypothetical protein